MDQPPSKELLFISIIGAILVYSWCVQETTTQSFSLPTITMPSELSGEDLAVLFVSGLSWLAD